MGSQGAEGVCSVALKVFKGALSENLLKAADGVRRGEWVLLTLHAVIDIDPENTLLLGSSVNRGV